jgi:hypothetical protein
MAIVWSPEEDGAGSRSQSWSFVLLVVKAEMSSLLLQCVRASYMVLRRTLLGDQTTSKSLDSVSSLPGGK